MFDLKKLTEGTLSSLESSIKKFLNEQKPEQHSIAIFWDGQSKSSIFTTAFITYKN